MQMAETRDRPMGIEREEIVGAGAHHRLYAGGHEGEIMATGCGAVLHRGKGGRGFLIGAPYAS